MGSFYSGVINPLQSFRAFCWFYYVGKPIKMCSIKSTDGQRRIASDSLRKETFKQYMINKEWATLIQGEYQS